VADILSDVLIRAPRKRVFDAVSTPAGFDAWWTKASTGTPREGARFTLDFGPEFQWAGTVAKCVAPSSFEILITEADPDWVGTRVGFELQPRPESATRLLFHHTGWPAANDHWRGSCYCWNAYLRLLKRHLEHGELVPYERRLDA
jgi:uncharacterized protein YndB with AHSA1/START domain